MASGGVDAHHDPQLDDLRRDAHLIERGGLGGHGPARLIFRVVVVVIIQQIPARGAGAHRRAAISAGGGGVAGHGGGQREIRGAGGQGCGIRRTQTLGAIGGRQNGSAGARSESTGRRPCGQGGLREIVAEIALQAATEVVGL